LRQRGLLGPHGVRSALVGEHGLAPLARSRARARSERLDGRAWASWAC